MELELYSQAGITRADFPQILAANPYSFDPEGLARPAAERFECVKQLAYEPGIPNRVGYEISSGYTSANTTTTSTSYTVSLGVTGTFLDQVTVADSNKWTWKNSSSTSNSTQDTHKEKLNLMMPSEAYAGPTILSVYVDKVYKTLMYSFLPPATTNDYCWAW